MPQVVCSRNEYQSGNQIEIPDHRCQSHCNASEILQVWEVAGLAVGKLPGCVILIFVMKYG